MRLARPAAGSRARRRSSGEAGMDSRTSASLATRSLAPFGPGGSYPVVGWRGWPGWWNKGTPRDNAWLMNVVVCAKQIPDPAAPGELDPQTKTLKREGKLILDDSDAYGVE